MGAAGAAPGAAFDADVVAAAVPGQDSSYVCVASMMAQEGERAAQDLAAEGCSRSRLEQGLHRIRVLTRVAQQLPCILSHLQPIK